MHRPDRIRELVQENNELREALAKAESEKYIDALTGIHNRRAFNDKLPVLVTMAHCNQIPLAMAFVDIDGMKRVNDSPDLGYRQGDALIVVAANVLRSLALESDLIARLGGDELCIVMPGFIASDGHSQFRLEFETASAINSALQDGINLLGLPEELHVGASVGLVVLKPMESPGEFLGRADKQLKNEKRDKKAALHRADISFQDERLLD